VLTPDMIKAAVKSVIPTAKWAKRVDEMTPRELLAIVLHFREKGKL
jgi:hypothetical protein